MIDNKKWYWNFAKKYLWLIFAVILYVPQIFFGYGTDDDTYLVLDAGRVTVNSGVYHPSRDPGYFIYELSTWALDQAGGSIATNMSTLLMTLLALLCFRSICDHLNVNNREYLLALFMIHPYVMTNACVTQDYMWAIGILLCGFLLLLKGKHISGAILLGLSIGIRLSSVFAVGGIIVWLFLSHKTNRKSCTIMFLIIVAVSLLSYLPSFANAGWTLGFLTPHMGTNEIWTPGLRLGKWLYKNILFWGIQALILLCPIVVLTLRGRKKNGKDNLRSLLLFSVAVVIMYEILFLQYPIEPAYLLPMLPFILLFLGTGAIKRSAYYIALIILLFSSNFIRIDLLRPDTPRHATSANVGVWIEYGPVIHDLIIRNSLRDCKTKDCWIQVMTEVWKKYPGW